MDKLFVTTKIQDKVTSQCHLNNYFYNFRKFESMQKFVKTRIQDKVTSMSFE